MFFNYYTGTLTGMLLNFPESSNLPILFLNSIYLIHLSNIHILYSIEVIMEMVWTHVYELGKWLPEGNVNCYPRKLKGTRLGYSNIISLRYWWDISQRQAVEQYFLIVRQGSNLLIKSLSLTQSFHRECSEMKREMTE